MPILCNWRLLTRAVEIGVDRAEFAIAFLDRWQGSDWWGIDPYRPYGEMNYDREADYLFAVHRLVPHAGRVKLIRQDSVVAAAGFEPESVDFVYIDGEHTYEAVSADIKAWWPKLHPRGIIGGHDWTDQPKHAGVKQAVTEFADEVGQVIYITTVEGYLPETCPSWLIYRSGMPGPNWRRC